MPVRIRRKLRVKRPKTMKRRKSRKPKTSGVVTRIARAPVPDRYFTKLRYHTIDQFTAPPFSTIPLTGYSQYRTSIFDPDLTRVGHQPMWHDQLQLMYTNYRVHGVGYRITVVSPDGGRLTLLALGTAVNATLETSWDTLTERKDTRVMRVPYSSAAPAMTYTGFIHNGKAWGRSKREFYDDDQFIAVMGNNPTKTTVLTLYAGTAAAGATIDLSIELTYYVEFMERVKVAGS